MLRVAPVPSLCTIPRGVAFSCVHMGAAPCVAAMSSSVTSTLVCLFGGRVGSCLLDTVTEVGFSGPGYASAEHTLPSGFLKGRDHGARWLHPSDTVAGQCESFRPLWRRQGVKHKCSQRRTGGACDISPSFQPQISPMRSEPREHGRAHAPNSQAQRSLVRRPHGPRGRLSQQACARVHGEVGGRRSGPPPAGSCRCQSLSELPARRGPYKRPPPRRKISSPEFQARAIPLPTSGGPRQALPGSLREAAGRRGERLFLRC